LSHSIITNPFIYLRSSAFIGGKFLTADGRR
jgi:hypothetical protein